MNFPVELKEKYQKIAAAIDFKVEDIDETFTRGSGHGGQNINKATNCVELTHRPTGTTVRFHHHRGLIRNRTEAWQLMILKLQEQSQGAASELGKKKHKIEKQKQRRSRRSKQKMVEEKRREGEVKKLRKEIRGNNEA